MRKGLIRIPERAIAPVTWICRILLGIVFIASGFAKGVDPWGTIYKLGDYFNALGLSFSDAITTALAFGLCAIEFMTGVFILLGCFRRGSAVVALAIMCLMTPLTLWIALENPVADCGCFGDAFTISNWATFWKNILLTAMAIWLALYGRRIHWWITPALQWIALLASIAFIFYIEFIGYAYQPLVDFRPYKIGNVLVAQETDDVAEEDIVLIYEKDGEQKEFGINDMLPDEEEGWVFVDRKIKGFEESSSSSTHDFRIYSQEDDFTEFYDGGEDITEFLFPSSGKMMIIFFSQLSDYAIASSYKINSLREWARHEGIPFIAIASASEQEIDAWEDISMADYPIYVAEDTSIKEAIRGNPALMYLENDTIKLKSSLSWIDVDDFMTGNAADKDPRKIAGGDSRILNLALLIYLASVAALVAVSFVPHLIRLSIGKKTKKTDRNGDCVADNREDAR